MVRAGEIVVVVGPNGAGKSTLLDAVLGVLSVRAGEITVDGARLRTFAQRAALFSYLAAEAEPASELYVPQIVDSASARANPAWAAELRNRLRLDSLASATADTLSRGERRRLLLFEALVCEKPFIVMDEPTGVFDPIQLLEVVAAFRTAAARGTGMLLTVHQLSDAEALASRILILNDGDCIACGTLSELCATAGVATGASLHEVFLTLLRARRAGEEALRAPA
jgi:ABC-type multidrug transport system ATPase subunit